MGNLPHGVRIPYLWALVEVAKVFRLQHYPTGSWSSESISIQAQTSSCANQDKHLRDSNLIKLKICYSSIEQNWNRFKFQMFCRTGQKVRFYFYENWNFLEKAIVLNLSNLILSGNYDLWNSQGVWIFNVFKK